MWFFVRKLLMFFCPHPTILPVTSPRLNREDPIDGYHHDFNAHHKPDGNLASVSFILWMEEILHHLGWLNPYK
jgi:hypothetical protein